MLGGGAGFFPRLGDDEDGPDIVDRHVDVCFDLAKIFQTHPDGFLDLAIDDLRFYVEATNRMTKRLKEAR